MDYNIVTKDSRKQIGVLREVRAGIFVWNAFTRSSRAHNQLESAQASARKALGGVEFEPQIHVCLTGKCERHAA